MRFSGARGFTLVELLIVITILGVLAAIVVFAVGAVKDKGEGSACKANLRQVISAEEAYFAQNGAYTDVANLVTAGLLREAPPTDDYVISADVVTGEITVDPAECEGL